jgi:hypothetical protein
MANPTRRVVSDRLGSHRLRNGGEFILVVENLALIDESRAKPWGFIKLEDTVSITTATV